MILTGVINLSKCIEYFLIKIYLTKYYGLNEQFNSYLTHTFILKKLTLKYKA